MWFCLSVTKLAQHDPSTSVLRSQTARFPSLCGRVRPVADGHPVFHPPSIDGHAGESGRPLGLGNPPETPPVPSLRGARGRYTEPRPSRQGDVNVNGPVVSESPALLARTISKGPGTSLQLTHRRSSLHLLSAGKPPHPFASVSTPHDPWASLPRLLLQNTPSVTQRPQLLPTQQGLVIFPSGSTFQTNHRPATVTKPPHSRGSLVHAPRKPVLPTSSSPRAVCPFLF